MRERFTQFAPVVFWAGVVVLLLGVVLIASNVTAGSGRGPVPTEYLLAGGVVLMLLSLLLRPDLLRRAFGIRTVRYGSNALVYSAVFLVILGLLNYVAGQVIANSVTITVPAHGVVEVYSSAGAPFVIFDVAGWFADASGTFIEQGA